MRKHLAKRLREMNGGKISHDLPLLGQEHKGANRRPKWVLQPWESGKITSDAYAIILVNT
jgi:hypothetical protein